MRIVRLRAENFKRIVAVDIEPDGTLQIVSGRNEQGKSSLLDALYAAIAGPAAMKSTPKPVREGEESASVTVDLGDYLVTRTWTAKGTTSVTVKSPQGAKYSSPQSLLDGLFGKITFDPLEFTRQSAKDQRQTLLSLVDLPFDLAEMDARRRNLYEARTDVGREVKHAEGVVDATPAPEGDIPEEEISGSDLFAEIQRAQTAQAQNQALITAAERGRAAREQAEQRVEEVRRLLAEVETDLIAAQGNEAALQRAAEEGLQEVPSIESLRERMDSLEETNAAVRQARAAREAQRALQASRETYADHTRMIEQIDEEKREGLAQAKFPVEGLGFDDDGITYQGVPFTQASASARLRVSMAIAMASNPDLRVLRITDGSLLDEDALRLVEEMATAHDFQVWIEMVGGDGSVGVTIEDGRVLGA